MRYRLMATYRGVPYEVGLGPSNSEVVLFAACPPPEELGFSSSHRALAQAGDPGRDRHAVGVAAGRHLPRRALHRAGRPRRHGCTSPISAPTPTGPASLGYWQVDRGVFELLTPREEVAELTEERVESHCAGASMADATGPMATYPYGTAPWPIAAPRMPVPAASA